MHLYPYPKVKHTMNLVTLMRMKLDKFWMSFCKLVCDIYPVFLLLSVLQEARKYAEENGLFFMETSAKTAINVNDIFYEIGKILNLTWFPSWEVKCSDAKIILCFWVVYHIFHELKHTLFPNWQVKFIDAKFILCFWVVPYHTRSGNVEIHCLTVTIFNYFPKKCG